MAESGQTRQRSAQSRDRDHQARRSPLSKRAEAVSRNVGAVRDLVMRSVLAPVNAVMLTRRHMEEVLEDAVKRGRMTRDDAQQMLQSLLQRGAQQTDDFLADLERLLARGSELEERPARSRGGQAKRRNRPRRPASNLPVSNYDELSAADVQDRLEGLTAAQLRKLRDYERRNANRKTVLDRIERKLR
jgi:polyhydroxyalkanoate synthesis regulator phasin